MLTHQIKQFKTAHARSIAFDRKKIGVRVTPCVWQNIVADQGSMYKVHVKNKCIM